MHPDSSIAAGRAAREAARGAPMSSSVPPESERKRDAPKTASISVDVLERLEDLGAVEEAWGRLAEAAPQRLPMLGPAWGKAFLAHRLRPGERFLVLVARAGDEVVGVLPLVRRPHETLGDARPRLAAPHDLHTRAGDAVLARGFERPALLALCDAARRREPRAFSIDVRGVRETSPTLAALEGGVPGASVLRAPSESGSFCPAAGGYDAWHAGLSDNFRRNVRKASNRLSALPHAFVRLVKDAADPARLDDFLALEASGWKGKEGTAIAQDPSLVAFYRALTEGLHRRGALEWHVLEIEGRPAAMHLAARTGRALVLVKIAYDESQARLGPGNLLFDRVAREALFEASDFDEMNCTTDMPWHRNWELPRSAYHDVSVVPTGATSFVLGVLPTKARAALRRVPGLVPLVRAVRRLGGRKG